ncbi:flavodoxin [Gallibacter intestinalis]|jgi:flavodoxin I|uniref:Flavodoxin n=1 Tax=Gallibacter intestinalis TaxID=2779356 RepID=A0ABR9QVD2_9FIRM|nr:flavodoxin [Gallibacter intestinalis]MBE5034829.1 flavodoxin [Gallibacter intestinalis]
MSKVAVVYWSGTGNTEAMAFKVLEGIKSAGGEAEMFTASEFASDKLDDFDAVAFGCPSMGSEVLEESEFEPMFTSCEGKLQGKKIALFGSYGWGDGEWMRNWEERCIKDGAQMACDFVICNEAPDAAAEEACVALGKALV